MRNEIVFYSINRYTFFHHHHLHFKLTLKRIQFWLIFVNLFFSLQQKAKEKSLPNDDPIWREIKIWNEKYIDVNECLKKNLLLMREKNQLKEKVDSLNRTVKVSSF